MRSLFCAFFFVAALQGAEFVNGQAARAVLGQPSFSAREAGVAASSMVISDGQLYVADSANRVLTYNLARIPGIDDDLANRASSSCALCGFAPLSSIPQPPVAPGSSSVSVYGKSLAAIDAHNHRVLIWRDVTTAAASAGPDVSLDISDPSEAAISQSTLINPVSIALDQNHLFVGDAALHRVLVWKSLPAADNQPADLVLGQHDFSSGEAPGSPRADTINEPDALVSDGTNLYVGDSRDRRILVFSPADSALASGAIENSASLSSEAFAPGTLLTLTGASFGEKNISSPDGENEPLPVKLGGVEVFLNGVPLPLLSVSPTEIRTQLSYTTANGSSASLYVREEHSDGSVTVTNPVPIALTPASPGLFAFGGNEPRAGMLLHSSADSAGSQTPVSAQAPAAPGEVVSVWATGLHVINAPSDPGPVAGIPYSGSDLSLTPLHAVVNGVPAEVISAVLPETSIGVYELKIALPTSLSGPAAQLSISQDGATSNTVTFPVRNVKGADARLESMESAASERTDVWCRCAPETSPGALDAATVLRELPKSSSL